MPLTPFHMGPGMLAKGVLRKRFSLMVFAWAQVIMDIQPLVVLVTGRGRLHGITHTYVGATLIAVLAAVTGKYLSEWVLALVRDGSRAVIVIGWPVALASAFIGTFSHVLLDSFVHLRMEPLFPFSSHNALMGVISLSTMYKLCIYSGVLGAIIYFAGSYWIARRSRL